MKTFTQHMQDCVGATYPLEDILNNLSPEETEEEAHIYAKEVALEALKNASENLIEWSYEKYPNFKTAKEAITLETNIPKL